MVMQTQSICTGEIIGPSGAGKSTLSDLLNSVNKPIAAGITILGTTEMDFWPKVLLFPSLVFLRMVIEDGTFNIENGKQIVRLHAFYEYFRFSVLRKKTIENGMPIGSECALFLDEGVVFSLSAK